MKAKILLFFAVVFLTNQSFGIGLPHSLAKKKKIEVIESTKKENRFDKKAIVWGKGLSFVMQKMQVLLNN